MTRASGLVYNVTMKYPNKDRQKRKDALKMRLSGMSYNAIGESLGISRQRIQQLLSPPKHIRDIVLNRAGGRCQNCGLIIGRSGHIHHQGSKEEDYNDVGNLQLLCITCHRKAHNESGRQWNLSGKIRIKISQDLKEKLQDIGLKDESFDDVVRRLLDRVEKEQVK